MEKREELKKRIGAETEKEVDFYCAGYLYGTNQVVTMATNDLEILKTRYELIKTLAIKDVGSI